MEDEKNNKPIEVPLRGRPRKRDAEAESFSYDNVAKEYFDVTSPYSSQQFMNQAQFFESQNSRQTQESMTNPYFKQQNHSNGYLRDDRADLFGFETQFPQRSNLPNANEYSKLIQARAEGHQNGLDLRLSDYLDPGNINQMSFREYSCQKGMTQQLCRDRRDNAQKLPDFSSFVSEFRVSPSNSFHSSQSLGNRQQFQDVTFPESSSMFEPQESYKDKNEDIQTKLEKGSAKNTSELSNAPSCPRRVGTGSQTNAFHNSFSSHRAGSHQGIHEDGLFESKYPFREGFPTYPQDNSMTMHSVNGNGNVATHEGFFTHSPQATKGVEHDMYGISQGHHMRPGYAPRPMNGINQDGRLTASLFPVEHSAFRNPLQQVYAIPEGVGHNGSWMNRKKRKNNPLLLQYIRNNQTFHPSIIHPSKYSSLDFIQGVDNGQKMYLGSVKRTAAEKSNGNSIFPLFLNSNKEITDEFKDVVQNFKNSVNGLDFNNVTVQQLKNLMKEFGLNHTGKKNELIERLQSTLKKIDGKETSKPEKQSQDKSKELDDFGFYFF